MVSHHLKTLIHMYDDLSSSLIGPERKLPECKSVRYLMRLVPQLIVNLL